MKTITVAVAICLSLPIVKIRATPQDEEFQKLARDYIERELQTNRSRRLSWAITGLMAA